MKKTLVALAALSATAGAFAQSSVTFYGVLDASVGYIKNPTATAKSVTVVNDSAIQSSLWGFKGSEDLGSGLRANFNLQSDARMDTGAVSSAEFFRREAYVGLSSADLGELRVGRTMSPAIANAQGGVVLPGNSIGVSTAIATGVAADFFTKNALTYYTPDMGGVKAVAQYAFGERNTDNTVATPSSSASRKMAGSVVYQAGTLRLGTSGESVRGFDGKSTRNWYNVTAQYALGDLKLGAGFFKVKLGNSTTAAGAGATAAADVGKATTTSSQGFNLSVGYQFNVQTIVALTHVHTNKDSDLTNITARYALSKRTVAYSMLGYADNGGKGINFTPYFQGNSGVANKKQGVLAFGVIHAF